MNKLSHKVAVLLAVVTPPLALADRFAESRWQRYRERPGRRFSDERSPEMEEEATRKDATAEHGPAARRLNGGGNNFNNFYGNNREYYLVVCGMTCVRVHKRDIYLPLTPH